jgi:hypothetical protein
MFVEVNPVVLARPRELVAKFCELSFDLWRIDCSTQGLVPLEASAPLAEGHLLASRSER